MLTDENDIIIRLAEKFRVYAKASLPFSVHYKDEDAASGLAEGSTEKHLEVAAEEAGLEVVRKGETQASLRKKPTQQARVLRA